MDINFSSQLHTLWDPIEAIFHRLGPVKWIFKEINQFVQIQELFKVYNNLQMSPKY